MLAACEDDRGVIAEALAHLDGRPLTPLTASGPAGDVAFDFGGPVLRAFALVSPASDADWLNWMLFMPDGRVLMVGPGGRWVCKGSCT